MEKEKKVVDASVVAKWFLNEEDSDKAINLRDRHVEGESILIVPDLLFIEVLNVLRYKEKDSDKISQANKSLWDLNLKIERVSQSILDSAAKLSIKNNLSIYDSIYAALANLHGANLITADEDMAKMPNAVLLSTFEQTNKKS